MVSDSIAAVQEAFAELSERTVELVPDLVAALGLLLVGVLLARILRSWSARLVGRVSRFTGGRTVQTALRRVGIERPVGEIVGSVLFWVVFVIFLTAATETLGLPVVATWLRGVSDYLPRVLLAVLIVLAGLLGGAVVREIVSTAASAAGVAARSVLGRAAQAVIVLIAVVTAVDQLGIESQFFTVMVMVVVASAVGGTALAFGLGARTSVANIIACHYLRQVYRVGQKVQIADTEGRIVEITRAAVILDTTEGRVLVPAKTFDERVSVLVREGS